MGFSSVVLVGHDDGGILALMAAQNVQASSNSFNVCMLPYFPASIYLKIICYLKLHWFISRCPSFYFFVCVREGWTPNTEWLICCNECLCF